MHTCETTRWICGMCRLSTTTHPSRKKEKKKEKKRKEKDHQVLISVCDKLLCVVSGSNAGFSQVVELSDSTHCLSWPECVAQHCRGDMEDRHKVPSPVTQNIPVCMLKKGRNQNACVRALSNVVVALHRRPLCMKQFPRVAKTSNRDNNYLVRFRKKWYKQTTVPYLSSPSVPKIESKPVKKLKITKLKLQSEQKNKGKEWKNCETGERK